MYSGNPFPPEQTLRIDEDSIQALTVSGEVRAVVLAPGSGVAGRSIDVRRFENLEYAHIAGRSVVDYSAIHAARSVKNLFLVNYKHPDLGALTAGPLDSLRLSRGRLESIAVSADFALLQGCSRLKGLELKRLVITATPASRLTLPSLEGASLSELFLSVPAQKVREVSRLLPDAAVSNGDVWYRHGELGEGADPLLKSV